MLLLQTILCMLMTPVLLHLHLLHYTNCLVCVLILLKVILLNLMRVKSNVCVLNRNIYLSFYVPGILLNNEPLSFVFTQITCHRWHTGGRTSGPLVASHDWAACVLFKKSTSGPLMAHRWLTTGLAASPWCATNVNFWQYLSNCIAKHTYQNKFELNTFISKYLISL